MSKTKPSGVVSLKLPGPSFSTFVPLGIVRDFPWAETVATAESNSASPRNKGRTRDVLMIPPSDCGRKWLCVILNIGSKMGGVKSAGTSIVAAREGGPRRKSVRSGIASGSARQADPVADLEEARIGGELGSERLGIGPDERHMRVPLLHRGFEPA